MTAGRRRHARAILVGLAAWAVGFELHATLLHGAPTAVLFGDNWPYEAVLLAAVGACLARVVLVRENRAAWALITAGALSWTAGDAYYTAALQGLKDVPIPSPADAGYLGFYPLVFAGLVLLARPRRQLDVWLDGLIAALSAAAVSAAVVLDVVLHSVGGAPLMVATNLAYPAGDLILLGLVAGAVAGRRRRSDASALLLALALLLFCLTDSGYLIGTAANSYTPGGWLDGGWVVALVLVACAAWQQPAPPPAADREPKFAVLPLLFATAALGLLVLAGLHHVNPLAIGLSAGSLVAVIARLALTVAEHRGLLRASRRDALTDGLTGLRNRRSLVRDVERRMAERADDTPLVLALFDLDGFKHYNDTFGHAAGDVLLARLAAAFRRTLDAHGDAYRVGGDEFCALIADRDAAAVAAAAAASLSEAGDGYAVGCSHGMAALPREAPTLEDALNLADIRMYDQKHERRHASGRGAANVLLKALSERDGELASHVRDVGELAGAVAGQLRLPTEEIRDIRRAGQLHDIGKVAIPDEILNKRGALDPDEWAVVRGHTVVGARIVAADPALATIAAIVRSSHERFDGTGYPDRLAREAIPLGARVVAVCDAFAAMRAERAHAAAVPARAALHELHRGAGRQFDPNVVEALAQVWEAREAAEAIGAVPFTAPRDETSSREATGTASRRGPRSGRI
jgi:two-component system, cell cycle response regulator